jgi:acetyl esterase
MTSEMFADGDEIALSSETLAWQRSALALTGEIDDSTVDSARRGRFASSQILAERFTKPPEPDVTWRDHQVGPYGVLVRECRPPEAAGPHAAYVYLHGGAFWHGAVNERVNESLVSERTARTGAISFVVDYRLAPEFGCPAAIEDTLAVLEWLHQAAGALDVDPGRVLLGGISAGANIAAATTNRLGRSPLLAGLLLEVPAIDLRAEGTWDDRFAAVNGLNTPDEMKHLYSSDGDPADPDLSPLLAPSVAGFPATHVVTAEYDPWRRGGELLAGRLRAADVRVTATRHIGALHGSVGLTARDPIAAAWQDDVCAAIGRLARSIKDSG